MTIKDTIPLMLSDDWKDRLVAEYWQTKIRYERLIAFAQKATKENIAFGVISTFCQLAAMDSYLSSLRERASIKGIKLGDEEE